MADDIRTLKSFMPGVTLYAGADLAPGIGAADSAVESSAGAASACSALAAGPACSAGPGPGMPAVEQT